MKIRQTNACLATHSSPSLSTPPATFCYYFFVFCSNPNIFIFMLMCAKNSTKANFADVLPCRLITQLPLYTEFLVIADVKSIHTGQHLQRRLPRDCLSGLHHIRKFSVIEDDITALHFCESDHSVRMSSTPQTKLGLWGMWKLALMLLRWASGLQIFPACTPYSREEIEHCHGWISSVMVRHIAWAEETG